MGARLFGVWGTGPSTVYALGDNGTFISSNGNNVWAPGGVIASGPTFFALWGSSPQNIYAVGTQIFHLYGSDSWSSQLDANPYNISAFTGIWGSSAGDVYAVGVNPQEATNVLGDPYSACAIAHSTGGGYWQVEQSPSFSCAAVWGSSSYDVYVVGSSAAGSAILHRP
jgi:hypothetical protein